MNTTTFYGSLIPEHKLLHAIIKFAIIEHDTDYFKSDVFEEHCNLLGLQVDILRNEIYKQLGVKIDE